MSKWELPHQQSNMLYYRALFVVIAFDAIMACLVVYALMAKGFIR